MKTDRAFCLLNVRPLAAIHSFQFRSPHNGHSDLCNRMLAGSGHTDSGRVWLPPGYSVRCESMRAGREAAPLPGLPRLPRLIIIWLEPSEEAVTQDSVDTWRWSGGRQKMRASSFHKCVISSVLVLLLFCRIENSLLSSGFSAQIKTNLSLVIFKRSTCWKHLRKWH